MLEIGGDTLTTLTNINDIGEGTGNILHLDSTYMYTKLKGKQLTMSRRIDQLFVYKQMIISFFCRLKLHVQVLGHRTFNELWHFDLFFHVG